MYFISVTQVNLLLYFLDNLILRVCQDSANEKKSVDRKREIRHLEEHATMAPKRKAPPANGRSAKRVTSRMGTPMSKDSDEEYEYDDSEDFDEEIERDVAPKYDSQSIHHSSIPPPDGS